MDNVVVEFCNQWLNTWTGNKPDRLINFYTKDALYIDPANKNGLKGHDQLLPYFKKLLSLNPDWKWEAVEIIPTEKGFTLKWKATIPVKDKIITEYGLDIVEIDNNKISRNEVYFDRSELLKAMLK